MCLITEIVGDEEFDEIFLHTKIIIYWYGWIIEIYEIFNFFGQNCGMMEFSKMIYSEGLVFWSDNGPTGEFYCVYRS